MRTVRISIYLLMQDVTSESCTVRISNLLLCVSQLNDFYVVRAG
jgi:hypothetical protein